MEKEHKRLAVLVGCNYQSTMYELHGCINDVLSMKETLVNRFAFERRNIQLLTDQQGSNAVPTGANIRRALESMVQQAENGDVLFFHYSGHGTRIPSLKPGNPLRQDEAIVPSDFNLITDVDFRRLANGLPNGASFTMLSDSCHSGGLIDKEKEQIGPSSLNLAGATTYSIASKFIPFKDILNHLKSQTQINTSDYKTHFLHLFGDESSLKFRLNPLDKQHLEKAADEGILLSGCQANETCADMNPVTGGGKAFGAFSAAVEAVLKEHVDQQLSNAQVVRLARKVLKAQGFAQHPCLYCSDDNADALFLCQPPSSSNLIQ